jgi:hypothetical protein
MGDPPSVLTVVVPVPFVAPLLQIGGRKGRLALIRRKGA